MNSAKKDPQEGYRSLVEGQPVYVHPSSSLFNRQPPYVVYHQIVVTSKEYMREAIAIDPRWLTELAPTFFKVANSKSQQPGHKKQKIAPLHDRFNEDDSWRLSKRRG